MLVGMLSVVSPGGAIAAAVALIFVAACFLDLGVALAGFTVLIFFEQFAGSTGAAKAAGFVLAAAWGIRLIAQPHGTPFLPRARPWLGGAALLFVFLGFASVLWAEDPAETISSAMRLGQVVVLYLVAYSATQTPARAHLLTWAFMTGAFLAAATGLVTGEGFSNTDRLTGGILDPNFFAGSLVAAAGIGSVLMLDPRRSPPVRLVLLAFVVTHLLALFRTESRGGLVALGAVLLTALVVSGRLRVRAVVLALLVATAGIGYFTALASLESRERIVNFTAEGGAGRSDQWRIALKVAADHPVLGVGLGNFPVVEIEYTASDIPIDRVRQILEIEPVVHNSYLELLVELGPIGLLAMLVAVLGPAVVAWRAVREPEADTLLRGLLVGLVALLVAYFFLSGQYEKQLWLLSGVTVGAVDAFARRGARARLGHT